MTSAQRKEVELGFLAGSDVEFRAETTYFLILDRFSVGNPQKDREDDEMFDATHQDRRKYWGGDLQGVMDRIPYLHPLGATAVWTTPLFEQVESMTCGEQKGSHSTTPLIHSMNHNDKNIGTLNKLLRGELSAIETYGQAIDKFAGEPEAHLLA